MKRTATWTAVFFAAALFTVEGVAEARDRAIGPPPRPGPAPASAGAYEVREVSVDGTIRNQVAEVQVSHTLHNPTGRQIEAELIFPLPHDGAVRDFILMVDGAELPGELMGADEARRIYESIVRRRKDPALLEYVGRGLLKTSVFPIPAGEDRTLTLRYTALCRRDHEAVEFAHPLGAHGATGGKTGKLSVTLHIRADEPIKSIYSPTHDPRIDRRGDREATVTLEERHVASAGDFRLFYDLAEGDVGTTVLSYRPEKGEDGYFLVLASPGFRQADREPLPKTVLFVLDQSGSMSGKKIEQAREAVRFVLDNLNEGDTFNIIAYDSRIVAWKEELERYTPETRTEAAAFVDAIRASGGTNIDGALDRALRMIPEDGDRPSYVLFLTDGLPTAGERDEMAITRNASRANKAGARIVSFGVGHDVNARLLDRISEGNGGVTEYVRPDEDIEAAVARFYSRVTAPVLSDIEIQFAGAPVNRTLPHDIPDLFEGGQLVWVGRYADSGQTRVTIGGKVAGEHREFESAVELAGAGDDRDYAFIEQLWAVRRVGHLIGEIDLHGQSDELVDELVELSRRHGILTPYTAFLADENVELGARDVQLETARRGLSALDQTTGREGVAQRQVLQEQYAGAQRAPAGGYGAAMGGAAGEAAEADFDAAYQAAERRRGQAAAPGPGHRAMAANIRQVADRTFYRKNGGWLDAHVTEDEAERAVVIRQFSDAYFDLARRLTPREARRLAFDDTVTLRLEGRVYRIEVADPEDEG